MCPHRKLVHGSGFILETHISFSHLWCGLCFWCGFICLFVRHMISSEHSQGIFRDCTWQLGDDIISMALGVGVVV